MAKHAFSNRKSLITILLYGVVLACGLFAIKLVEYYFFSFRIQQETFIGLIALFFTLIGIAVGLRIIHFKWSAPPLAKPLPTLTPKEQQLLIGLAEGLTNQQLADKQFVSVNTIKTHLKGLYKKLNVSSRQQAVYRAKLLKIIEN